MKNRRWFGFLLAWALVAPAVGAAELTTDRRFYEETVAQAERGDPMAQVALGACLESGHGVLQDLDEAVRWYRRAAAQGDALGQYSLGACYEKGRGVAKDPEQAARYYAQSAVQGLGRGQACLGACYANGVGVSINNVEAYKWTSLAAAKGELAAKKQLTGIEQRLTKAQVAEAKRLAAESNGGKNPGAASALLPATPNEKDKADFPRAIGAGFFVTADGYLVTMEDVVRGAAKIKLLTRQGTATARLVRVDPEDGLVLLKAEGKFTPLPVTASRSVHLGSPITTVGFSGATLDEFVPRISRGEVAAYNGLQDPTRCFGLHLTIEPAGAGGAAVDDHGNVVGVVAARARLPLPSETRAPAGRWAVKSSFLLGFLESVPEASAGLLGPNTAPVTTEALAPQVETASALVLVY